MKFAFKQYFHSVCPSDQDDAAESKRFKSKADRDSFRLALDANPCLLAKMHDELAQLVKYFKINAREFPWRGEAAANADICRLYRENDCVAIRRDPYRVWLSEIMLQQTRAETVIPYYFRFLKKYPSLLDLSLADPDDVLKLWEGLGYYSRARLLWKCANEVRQEHKGRFPADAADLQKLSGIGPYTAGAISSLAFDRPAAAVDGNVLRVLSRLAAMEWRRGDPSDLGQARLGMDMLIKALCAEQHDTYLSPALINEALIEHGACVCTPRNPACELCPIALSCAAHAELSEHEYPLPKIDRAKPELEYTVLILVNHRNASVLAEERPPQGLLASLWQFPMLEGEYAQVMIDESLSALPIRQLNVRGFGERRHVFSHLVWNLKIYRVDFEAESLAATQLARQLNELFSPEPALEFTPAQYKSDLYSIESAAESMRLYESGDTRAERAARTKATPDRSTSSRPTLAWLNATELLKRPFSSALADLRDQICADLNAN